MQCIFENSKIIVLKKFVIDLLDCKTWIMKNLNYEEIDACMINWIIVR